MKFFFVQDYRSKYRYFSSKPIAPIQIKTSRWKEIWEQAKKKLMLLPQRLLRQEQAFGRILKLPKDRIQIYYSGNMERKKIRTKFYFFLQRQRTKHIVILIGETLLLPLSGLAGLLPGPNVFFGVLALLMITHWKALRGLNRLLKKNYQFVPSPLFQEWEGAVRSKREESFSQILGKIKKEYNLHDIHKILWK
ncbi:MAG: hypothetical protein ACLFVG_00815 [Candidatus Aminicenantes bacterium]